jgi:hypothetical protein
MIVIFGLSFYIFLQVVSASISYILHCLHNLSLPCDGYPLFNPNIRPGMNPKTPVTGKPVASCTECAANCDAVLFSA